MLDPRPSEEIFFFSGIPWEELESVAGNRDFWIDFLCLFVFCHCDPHQENQKEKEKNE